MNVLAPWTVCAFKNQEPDGAYHVGGDIVYCQGYRGEESSQHEDCTSINWIRHEEQLHKRREQFWIYNSRFKESQMLRETSAGHDNYSCNFPTFHLKHEKFIMACKKSTETNTDIETLLEKIYGRVMAVELGYHCLTVTGSLMFPNHPVSCFGKEGFKNTGTFHFSTRRA